MIGSGSQFHGALSRLGHPLVRWVEACKRLRRELPASAWGGELQRVRQNLSNAPAAPGPPATAPRRQFLLLDFLSAGPSLKLRAWQGREEDLQEFLAGMPDSSSEWLEKHGEATVPRLREPLEIRDYFNQGVSAMLSGWEADVWQAIAWLPRFRQDFRRRMRLKHWQRVSALIEDYWIAGDFELPPGAAIPGLEGFKNWRAVDKSAGALEMREPPGEWREFDREHLLTTLADPDGTPLLLRRGVPGGRRIRALYSRDESGWTDFFGALPLRVDAHGDRLELRGS